MSRAKVLTHIAIAILATLALLWIETEYTKWQARVFWSQRP